MTLAIDLSRTVVLVTGGSRGIGESIVRHLHAAGASVFFTYHARSDLAELLTSELGERAAAERLDMADFAGMPGLVDACVRRFGRLDVLVNNAAIFATNPFDGDSFDAWRAGWRRTFDINVFGAADLAWLAIRHMRDHGGGRIINIASRAAHRGELEHADYGASKAALVNLTKSIARSCAPDGILSFAVAPGFIETEMAAPDLDVDRPKIVGEIPVGYVGRPDQVAPIVAFLASPLGSYLNGATIDVNGGSYVR
ncbi:MAG TPA: SDR family NAD(P)-dependent oxidoreductase [Candidatus Eremiobacteraceae bacterium]|nr:SDR family NAD(P)-dependent oxidoreductase [Candidatus Eremiobacteraceae bacterium]